MSNKHLDDTYTENNERIHGSCRDVSHHVNSKILKVRIITMCYTGYITYCKGYWATDPFVL